MRLAIIGAGFFGYHIASQLARHYPGSQIEIFEREDRPLLGAGTTNQCRLHMGFHYPRSGYTIYQSIMGFDRFISQYGDFVDDVSDNLYAVHRDSLVTPDQYLAVMDSFSLPYERFEPTGGLFRHPDDIDLVIRVPEKSVDVARLRSRLSATFGGTLRLGTKITGVIPDAGLIQCGPEEFGPFDYIINATYSNPNMGLQEDDAFEVKWELAVLVLTKASLPPGTAVTIMDGAFVSVYPAYGGLHTLSSVLHTPMRRYGEYHELDAHYPNRHSLAAEERVAERISAHVSEHLCFENDVKEVWVTSKTKLRTDKGDSRVTEVRRNDRLMSVLCGKLDAVFEASDSILKEIV